MNKKYKKIKTILQMAAIVVGMSFCLQKEVQAQTYCTPVIDCSYDEYIESFSTTGGSVNITNNFTGCSSGYSNYTATHSHTGTIGTTVNFSFTNTPFADMLYSIWVDWNQDGDFNDPGELVYASANYILLGATTTGSFTIPTTATTGTTRLRIMAEFITTNMLSCPTINDYYYGEVEDYGFVVVAANACNSPTYTMIATTDATTSQDTICSATSSLDLNLSVVPAPASGITYQWQSAPNATGPWTNMGAPANSPNYTVTGIGATTYYRCQIYCQTTVALTSTSVEVVSFSPTLMSTQDGERCGPGTVQLEAASSPGSYVGWYDAPTGGLLLDTGNIFNTPSIANTTMYYAVAMTGGGGIGAGGRLAPPTSATGYSSGTSPYWGLIFDVTQTFTLTSVEVYPTSNGSFTVQLADLNNVVHQTAGPFNVTSTGSSIATGATAVTIPLNFTIPPGTDYTLRTINQTASLIRENPISGYSYPIPIGNVGFLTSGLAGTGTAFNTTYYYFYNWEISGGCESLRQPVEAFVEPTHIVDIGADTVICSGTSLTLDAGHPNSGAIYQWSNSATTQTTSVSTNGTYDVMVTIGDCIAYDTINVSVTPSPTVNLGSDTVICNGKNLVLNAANTGLDYLWSDNSTGSTLTVNSAGTYFVTVTNSFNCEASDTVNVDVYPLPSGSFDFIEGNAGFFTFTANAIGAESYTWDFGAGDLPVTVQGVNMFYTYNTPGNYTVTLTIKNHCGDSIVVTKEIAYTSVNQISLENKIITYPNPADDKLTIDNKSGQKISSVTVYDALGRKVESDNLIYQNDRIDIDVALWSSGIYTIQLKTDRGVVYKQFAISR